MYVTFLNYIVFVEITATQALENAKLMREKAVVENDMLKTQVRKRIVHAFNIL